LTSSQRCHGIAGSAQAALLDAADEGFYAAAKIDRASRQLTAKALYVNHGICTAPEMMNHAHCAVAPLNPQLHNHELPEDHILSLWVLVAEDKTSSISVIVVNTSKSLPRASSDSDIETERKPEEAGEGSKQES
jgi:hypothetical protein